MSRNLNDAHQLLQKQFLVAKAAFEQNNKGVQVILTCTYRSLAEQTALYNQPFDKKDNDGDGRIDEPDEKVTQAKALQSPHNYFPSFAIDVTFLINGKTSWDEKYFIAFSKYMKTENIEWGGDWKSFKDLPHYEIKNWKTKIK